MSPQAFSIRPPASAARHGVGDVSNPHREAAGLALAVIADDKEGRGEHREARGRS